MNEGLKISFWKTDSCASKSIVKELVNLIYEYFCLSSEKHISHRKILNFAITGRKVT